MGDLLKETNVSEAGESLLPYMSGVDPDDDKWRSLTRAKSDLTITTQERMIKYSQFMYITNPLAHRIVELLVAFTVGGGVRIVAQDTKVLDLLNKFWNDPVNDWDKKLPVRTRALCLYGELFMPVIVNPANGFVQMSYLNPLDVKQVVLSPGNIEIPLSVITKSSGGMPETAMRIIMPDEDPKNDTFGRLVGDIFAFSVNKLADASRGIGDMLTLIDYMSMYDSILFNASERSAHMNSWLWDVTIDDATKAQIDEFLKDTQGNPPRPGAIRAHNQKVTWAPLAPSFGASETVDMTRLFKLHILGGAGFPEFFFAEPGTGNRSVAESMNEPTMKTLQARQSYIKYCLEHIFRFQIDQAIIAGYLSKEVNTTFKIIMSKIGLRDVQRGWGALFRLSQSLQIAVERKWMTEAQCGEYFKTALDMVGLGPEAEVDVSTGGVEHGKEIAVSDKGAGADPRAKQC